MTNNFHINILIHTRGVMTSDEARFWESLYHRLDEQGVRLWLIGHFFPEKPPTIPYVSIPDQCRRVEVPESVAGDSFSFPSYLLMDDLLEKECIWLPLEEMDAKKKQCWSAALYYFYLFYAAVVKSIKPHLILIWNGMHAQEIILGKIAGHVGVPVSYLERSPFLNALQLDSEGVLGGSRVARASNWEWRATEDKSQWASAFQSYRQAYVSGTQSWWNQPDVIGVEAVREKFDIPEDKKVVLFLGQVYGDVQFLYYSPLFPRVIEPLKWFCQKMSLRDDVFILGKHHPKTKIPESNFAQIVGSMGVWTSEVALSDCLKVCDYVACVNSTVLFEGLLYQKPVLSMGQTILSHKNIMYEIDELDATADTVLEAWLEKKDFSKKIANAEDFGAWLLSQDIYSMSASESHFGMKGVVEFSSKLKRMSQQLLVNPNFGEIAYDSEAAVKWSLPNKGEDFCERFTNA